MSRDARDDDRHEGGRPVVHREIGHERPWSPAERLMLPRTPDRRAVALDRARYRVRESQTELLAVVGAVRGVPERELLASPADIPSLVDQDLVGTPAIAINNSPQRVPVPTAPGKDLPEAHR